MLEMIDLHIKSAFRKSKKSFNWHLKLHLIKFLDAVLYKTCKTHSINLKPSPIDFWRNSLTEKSQ